MTVHLVVGASGICGRGAAAALEEVSGAEVRRAELDDAVAALEGVEVLHMCAETWVPTAKLRPSGMVPEKLRELAASAVAAGVRRWIQLSSATVYGPDHRLRISERTVLRPVHAFERLKLAEEAWLRALAGGIEVVVLRSAWPFGAGEPVLDALLEKLRAGTVTLPEGGRSPRSFVAGQDLGRAFAAAARRGRGGGVYLVAGFDSSWRQLLLSVAAEAGVPARIRSLPYDLCYLRESARELATPTGSVCWPGRFGLDLLTKPHLCEDGWSRRELTWSPRMGSPSEAIAQAARRLASGTP